MKKYHDTIYPPKHTWKEVRLSDREELLSILNNVYLDLSFQSLDRWKDSDRESYMISVISNMAPSPIVIADAEECLENAVHPRDIEYYQSVINSGKKYVSCDGNNRTLGFLWYIRDYESMPHISIYVGDEIIKFDKTNDTIDKWPDKFWEYLQDVIVLFAIYTDITRTQLHELFVRINNGVKLNGQELRNAIHCVIAQVVRDYAEEFNPILKKLFPTNELNRRYGDQYILDFLNYYSGLKDNNPRNQAYMSDTNDTVKLHKKAKKVLNDWYKIQHSQIDLLPKYYNKGNSYNLYIFLVELSKLHFKIKDHDGFYKWFIEKEQDRLFDDTVIYYVSEHEGKTYKTSTDKANRQAEGEVQARLKIMMESLDSLPESIAVKVDKQRLASDKQRYLINKRDGGVRKHTGEKIPPHLLFVPDEYQVNHDVPYSDGGPTDVDNMSILSAEDNNKLGATKIE